LRAVDIFILCSSVFCLPDAAVDIFDFVSSERVKPVRAFAPFSIHSLDWILPFVEADIFLLVSADLGMPDITPVNPSSGIRLAHTDGVVSILFSQEKWRAGSLIDVS